jgi:ketosteroid isomerase-like protein
LADPLLACDGQVVVLGRSTFRARGSRERWTTRLCNVWTIRDGRVTRLAVYNDTAVIWRALGGRADYWTKDA